LQNPKPIALLHSVSTFCAC